jgi:regulation of enolase protein 1 (concanavalin A-like superfamily)
MRQLSKGLIILLLLAILPPYVTASMQEVYALADETILEEDFSGTLEDWTVQSGDWSIASGVLRQSSTGADRQIYANTALGQDRLRIEANIRFLDTNGSAELLIRRTEGDSHNSVRLDIQNGRAAMWINGYAYRTSYALSANTWYTVKAEVNGSNLVFFINDEQILERSDLDVEGTIFGLATSDGQVEFDNIRIVEFDTWDRSWSTLLESSNILKSGADRLNHPFYEYPYIGLGGTTLFAGPTGFTLPDAPNKPTTYDNISHVPALLYDYWWYDGWKRAMPFQLNGAYGSSGALDAGEIAGDGFLQEIDIDTGVLTTELNLNAAGQSFHTTRTSFVTPDGILVMRIEDSVAHTFRLQLSPSSFTTPSQSFHDKYSLAFSPTADGIVAEATDDLGEKMVLAVKAGGSNVSVDAGNGIVSVDVGPGNPGYLYFAPGSTLNEVNPAAAAASRGDAALSAGYASHVTAVEDWWSEFFARSQLDIPDLGMAKWYVRSLYYHGVAFGNAKVPPGAYATHPGGFNGSVLPEFDLVYSHFGLLYTNHTDVSATQTDWYEDNLANAEYWASQLGYPAGSAKYGWLMGWNGEPQDETLGWKSDFPGGNVAAMVLSQKQWTNEDLTSAKDLLEKVTKAQLHSQTYIDKWQGYGHTGVWSPSFWDYDSMFEGDGTQGVSAIWSIQQAQKYGISTPAWDAMLPDILYPEWYNSALGSDMTLLVQPYWWMKVKEIMTAEAMATYINVAATQLNYTFNKGWASVLASKLQLADEAYDLARQNLKGNEFLYDDNAIVELRADAEDFKKSPEIGAHGAYIAALAQMMVDGDSDTEIKVFPAVPDKWSDLGVSFTDFRTNGGILVSGEYAPSGSTVKLENTGSSTVTRDVLIRIPEGHTSAVDAGGLTVQNIVSGSFAKLSVTLAGGQSRTIELSSSQGSELPGSFHTLLPYDAATEMGSNQPYFGWTWSDRASSYILTVSKHADLSNPLFSQNVGNTAKYRLNASLEPGTTYYWSVTAVNANGSAANTEGVLSFATYGEPTHLQFNEIRYGKSYMTGSPWPREIKDGHLEIRIIGNQALYDQYEESFAIQEGAKGNFTATVKMDYRPDANGQQAGIIVRKDRDTFFRFVRKYENGLTFELSGPDTSGGGSYSDPYPAAEELYLRVVKRDDVLKAYLSEDNINFIQIGNAVAIGLGSEFGVGMVGAAHEAPEGETAKFDWFNYHKHDLNDEFTGNTLSSGWESAGSHTVNDGAVQLQVAANSGIGENRILQTPATEDFSLVTKLDYKPSSNYMQGGLLIWQDSSNYIKLTRTYENGNKFEFTGPALTGSQVVSDSVTGSSVHLKIEKSGNVYSASYSEDGSVWTAISSGTSALSNPKVGLAGGSWSNAADTVSFDWFRTEPLDDEFDAGVLDGRWSASPPYSLVSGKLEVAIAANSNDSSGRILQTPVKEDYALITKLDYKPTQNYQQAGLMIWSDASNYVKLTRVYNNGPQFEFSGAGVSQGTVITDSFAGTTVYLKLVKAGYYYRAYVSEDGDYWTPVGGYASSTAADPRIGLTASSFSASTDTAVFDWFMVE